MSNPLVSVVLPTFNGLSRGYLRAAAADVLGQTLRDLELIVVDDGSTEDIALGLADILADPRVRLVRQANQGLAGARKTGTDQARGMYVAFLDDDDRWRPDKLALQTAFLERHPDPRAGMTFCAVRLIDAAGQVIGARRKDANGPVYDDLVFNGNGITAPSAVLLKREVLQTAGSFDPAMRSLEDLDLWLRVARHYHIYAMPDYLADYRLHANTITARSFEREEAYEERLYNRLLAGDKSLDPRVIRSRMYARFALRHMSLGNYDRARPLLTRSRAERFAVRPFMLYLLTFLPPALLEAVKRRRRMARAAEAGLS